MSAERQQRYRDRQELRAAGFEFLNGVQVDVAALVRAQLLPPAESAAERVEQVSALLTLIAMPRVSAVLRVVLEELWLAHSAEPDTALRCDIDAVLSKNRHEESDG